MLNRLRQPLAGPHPARSSLLIGLLLIAFLLPYGLEAWWKFIPASVLIIWLMRALHPERYRSLLGIAMPLRAVAITLGLLAAVHLLSRLTIHEAAQAQHILYVPDGYPLGWRFTHLFQALNEEMFFRALLLGGLLRAWQRPAIVSILTAAGFSLAHLAFYRLSDGTVLTGAVLTTLFAFGLASNWLFMRYGHIGFSYALHAGWNTVRFTADYFPMNGQAAIPEATTFNLIEGSAPVLALGLGVLALSAACLYRQQR
jgi:membrane protease YdiL (CAAX protease family)